MKARHCSRHLCRCCTACRGRVTSVGQGRPIRITANATRPVTRSAPGDRQPRKMRLASKVAVPPIGQEADRHADPGQRVFPELHCFRNRLRQLGPPVPQVEHAAFGELASADHSDVASFCFGGRAQGAQQTNNPVSNRSSRSASSRGSLLGVRFCFYSARCQHAVAASHEWAPVKCRRARKRISLPALYPACCRAQDDRMPE